MQIVKQLIKRNYKIGRGGRKIDMIVIHVMEGDLPPNIKDPYSWFNDPEAGVSAHYGVDRDDKPVRQWVEEWNTAQHAGIVDRPTSKLVLARPGINPNDWTIGIENEGSGKEPPTPIQIVRNVELIRDICNRYNFPIDRDHVVGHHEIRREKDCPGLINVDELVKMARGIDLFTSHKKVLRRGDSGSEVEALQYLLVATGFMTKEQMNTGVGKFGPRTEKSFDEFLLAHWRK